MDWSTLVALAGVIVAFMGVFAALVGVGLTGFAAWLSYRDRAASHRQSIYEKQIEAYQAVLSALGAMNEKARQVFPDDDWSDAPDYDALYEKAKPLEPEWNAVGKAFEENWVIFSEPVWDKLNGAWRDWFRHDQEFPVRYIFVRGKMWEDYILAKAAVRDALGVDPLTKDSFDTIYSWPRQRPSGYSESIGDR